MSVHTVDSVQILKLCVNYPQLGICHRNSSIPDCGLTPSLSHHVQHFNSRLACLSQEDGTVYFGLSIHK